MFTKQKVAMIVAEFLGTAILTYVVLSVLMSSIGIGYFIALAAGLTVGLLTLLVGGISGAVLNPAITVGLWTVRKLSTYQALIYIAVQMLGGLCAYALFKYVSGASLDDREIAKFTPEILVAETVGTAVLAMGFAAAAYQNVTSSVKAFVIGGALIVGVLVGASQAVAGLINPAVALGTNALDVASWGSLGNFVLGPILGAVIGMNLYNLLFAAGAPITATAAVVGTAAAKPLKSTAISRASTAKSKTKVAKAKTTTKVAKKKK